MVEIYHEQGDESFIAYEKITLDSYQEEKENVQWQKIEKRQENKTDW